MQIVHEMAAAIVKREGGLVDDPNDRGGITNHGVSLKYLRGKGLVGDVNHDGVVDEKDIIACSVEQAIVFFIHDFFEAPQYDLLPDCLHPLMFDMAVMSGTGGAGMVLQNALNDGGFGSLKVDGGCGRQTQAACARAHATLGDKGLVELVVNRRVKMLYDIALRDPSQRKYVVTQAGAEGGWITRTKSFLL